MINNIENKVIVLTGASGGIGTEIADMLANNKAKIVLLGGRNKLKLDNVKTRLESLGAQVLSLDGDLKNMDFIDNSVKTILNTFGKIDVLINNAGIAENCPFEKVSFENYDNIMETNSKIPFFVTQKFLPYLKKSDYAMIINVCSIVGHIGYKDQSVYSASKHALLGWSQSLAKEIYKDNVRVHVISPGGVYTDMIKITRPDLTGEGMIMPKDIANVLEFLINNRTNAVIDNVILHRATKEPF